MMRLLRVELRRLWARRVTLWASVGVLLVVALSGFVAFRSAVPPSDAQVADARSYYETDVADWEENGEQYLADCEAEQEGLPADEQWGCDDLEPRLEWYLPPTNTFVPSAEALDQLGTESAEGTDDVDPAVAAAQSSVWNSGPGVGTVDEFGILVLGLVLVVGVSFVTAEVNSGSLGMWLTFEPRRQRVYWSKAVAAAVGTVPMVLVGFALVVGAAYAGYASYGALGDVTSQTWTDVAAFTWRLVVAGMVVGAVGVALGILLRHAAAAIGVVVAAVGVTAMFAWQLGDLQRWLPMTNLTAWLTGGAVYSVEDCTPNSEGVYDCVYTDHVVSSTHGGLLLLAVAVVLTLAAVVSFRRRNLT